MEELMSLLYYFDPTYILIIIGVIICSIASMNVNYTYKKYSTVRSMTGMTGAQAAQQLLHTAGIYDVSIQHVPGNLTDHYDPRNKVLRLSDTVFNSPSVAAIGVAAHECGHAIQHQKGYVPLVIRSALVTVAQFGSGISWPIIIAGIFFGYNQTLINIGILLFSAAVLFQIVTLPVEINASRRAVRLLKDTGILRNDEAVCTKKVLGAAALTYVASAAAAILQLLRLVILFGGRNDD